MSRFIALDRAQNFRDLGGYQTRDGRTTTWGRLYRSDQLGRLTDDDVRIIREDLGVKLVVDLRSHKELDLHGIVKGASEESLKHVHISLNRPGNPDDKDLLRRLGELYLWKLEGEMAPLGEVMKLIAQPANLPLVFHCMGGKDRTGIVACLTLGLLGVPDETIVADYVLTEEVRLRNWTPEREAQVRKILEQEGMPFEVIMAPAEAMEVFIAGLHERHGSYEQLAREIGMSDADIASLRANLLE